MGRAVIFSAQAGRDLEAITGFIAQRSEEAAVRFGDALFYFAFKMSLCG